MANVLSTVKLTTRQAEALAEAASVEGVTYLPKFRPVTLEKLVDLGFLNPLDTAKGFVITRRGLGWLLANASRTGTDAVIAAHHRTIAVGDRVRNVFTGTEHTVTLVDRNHVGHDGGLGGDFTAFEKVEPKRYLFAKDIAARNVARMNEPVAEPKLTATQRLARLQAEAPRHECGLSRQSIDCMCADAAGLDVDTEELDDVEGCDASIHDGPGPEDGCECGEPVTANGRCADHPLPEPLAQPRTRLLYDRVECQAMIVLGSLPDFRGLAFRYENDATDTVREVRTTVLQRSDRYTAVCSHYRGRMDTCSGCDADEEREEQRAELIRQANAATPDPITVPLTPEGQEFLATMPYSGVRVVGELTTRNPVAVEAEAASTVDGFLRERSVRYPDTAANVDKAMRAAESRPLTLAEYLVKTGTALLRDSARAARC